MNIQHSAGDSNGLLFVEADGKRVAALAYDKADGVMVIAHTEVDRSLRGQNIGYQLVSCAADFARENSLKISPVCPFAKAQFDKYPEWKDLMV